MVKLKIEHVVSEHFFMNMWKIDLHTASGIQSQEKKIEPGISYEKYENLAFKIYETTFFQKFYSKNGKDRAGITVISKN